MPSILVLDLGGCEGCIASIMNSYPKLEKKYDLYISYLGNLNLDREFDFAIVSGPVSLVSSEKIDLLKKVRENSKILVAYGSCASVGGIFLYSKGQNCRFASIGKIVDIDYSIPGCPPASRTIINFLNCIEKKGGRFLELFKALTKYQKLSGFDLIDDVVLTGLCVGCGACTLSCPTEALQLVDGVPDLIVEKCIRCGTCIVRCPKFTQNILR